MQSFVVVKRLKTVEIGSRFVGFGSRSLGPGHFWYLARRVLSGRTFLSVSSVNVVIVNGKNWRAAFRSFFDLVVHRDHPLHLERSLLTIYYFSILQLSGVLTLLSAWGSQIPSVSIYRSMVK